MKAPAILLMVTLLQTLVLAATVASVPLDFASRLREKEQQRLQREQRRVGKLDTSAGPKEYMKSLVSQLTDENGRPKNLTEDPTNIWCLLDQGGSIVLATTCARGCCYAHAAASLDRSGVAAQLATRKSVRMSS